VLDVEHLDLNRAASEPTGDLYTLPSPVQVIICSAVTNESVDA